MAHPGLEQYEETSASDVLAETRGVPKGSPAAAAPENFEDRFIDNVLTTLREVRETDNVKQNPFASPQATLPLSTPPVAFASPLPTQAPPTTLVVNEQAQQWHEYEKRIMETTSKQTVSANRLRNEKREKF